MTSPTQDFFKSNFSFLKKHQPHIWKTFAESPPAPVGELIFAQNGKPNLRFIHPEKQHTCFHDPLDPSAEGAQFLKMIPEDSTGVAALLGMGLGYSVISILKNRPQLSCLIVFELEPGFFIQALHSMDLSSALTDKRLILSINPDPDASTVMAPATRLLHLEDFHTLKHLSAFAYNQAGYQKLDAEIFSVANSLNVAGATVLKFGTSFMENRFQNLLSMNHDLLLTELKDLGQDVPAILVAGGPSLNKNIHLLSEAKEKAVIIAVDSALPALIAHHIFPDFITSIDPQKIVYEKIADSAPMAQGISLICTPWVNPKVSNIFPAEKVFWAFTNSNMEKWLNQLLGKKIGLGQIQTVAHLNLNVAQILGCSPIIFMGQDLAFDSTADHAEHTILTSNDQVDQLKQKGDLIWVNGTNGGKVSTSRAFASMKTVFENLIGKHPNHYINATEGGAHIQGTEVISFQEVLTRYLKKSHHISKRIRSCIENSPPPDAEKLLAEFHNTLKQIKRIHTLIKKSDELAHSALKQAAQLKKLPAGRRITNFDTLPKTLKRHVSKIDDFHRKIDNHQNIWELLDEITLEGLKQSDRMKAVISQLEGKPDLYLEWLEQNLKRLEHINTVRTEVLTFFEKQLTTVVHHQKKESGLLNTINQSDHLKNNLLKLMRLYFESGDLVLATPVLDRLKHISPACAEILFFSGILACYATQYKLADSCFQKAIELAPDYKSQIDLFRQQLGDEYLEYAQTYLNKDRKTHKRMLIKGLRCCSNHVCLTANLQRLAEKDLKTIKDHETVETLEKDEALICKWHQDLSENDFMESVLKAENAAAFYSCHGKLMVLKKKFHSAAQSFGKAVTLIPDNPEYHIFMTDTLFAMSEFEQGIHHLKKAVVIDRNYAKFWENIGDNLQTAEQFTDAISAYEQCFMALPEHIDLLKKIGACYLAMDKLDAAREALQQYKRIRHREQANGLQKKI